MSSLSRISSAIEISGNSQPPIVAARHTMSTLRVEPGVKVIALHVKTESIGYRRQNIQGSVRPVQTGEAPQRSDIAGSHFGDHEISQSDRRWTVAQRPRSCSLSHCPNFVMQSPTSLPLRLQGTTST